MIDLHDKLCIIVPALSISFVAIITSINLYSNLRNRFPACVNCWFCNTNSQVPYSQANSWNCSGCQQYNGFTKDGDYNRDIPAQRNAALNLTLPKSPNKLPAPSNGLCPPCNRNQELKIQQFAGYETTDDDDEFHQFCDRLEQMYRLCSRCERHLQRHLTRVKNNVLGSKLAQIGSRGLSALDHLNKRRRRVKTNRWTSEAVQSLCWLLIFLLAVFSLLAATKTDRISYKSLMAAGISEAASQAVLNVFAATAAAKDALFETIAIARKGLNLVAFDGFDFFSDEIRQLLQNEAECLRCMAAVSLTGLLIVIVGARRMPLVMLLLWSAQIVLNTPNGAAAFVFLALGRIFLAIIVCCVSLSNAIETICHNKTDAEGTNNGSFHRLLADEPEVASDDDDSEIMAAISTKSVTPSVFKDSFLRDEYSSFSSAVMNSSFGSRRGGDIFNTSFCPAMVAPSLSTYGRSQANKMYDVPDEFQSRLTGLNISGNSATNKLPFEQNIPSFGSVAAASSTLSIRNNNLICPSRLSLMAAEPQTSWVAGGYWNGMVAAAPTVSTTAWQSTGGLFAPILSRTSSQSSGFESQAAANDSRESSVSETLQPGDSVSQCGVKSPPLHKSLFHFGDETKIHQQKSIFSSNSRPNNICDKFDTMSMVAPPPIYHQFGTQRVSQQQQQRLLTFNKFAELPIQRSSLLKSPCLSGMENHSRTQ